MGNIDNSCDVENLRNVENDGEKNHWQDVVDQNPGVTSLSNSCLVSVRRGNGEVAFDSETDSKKDTDSIGDVADGIAYNEKATHTGTTGIDESFETNGEVTEDNDKIGEAQDDQEVIENIVHRPEM